MTPQPELNRCNPFETRFVRPGTLPFRFDAGSNMQDVVARFREAGFRGQIVGPHGCGKTTLAHSIVREVANQFQEIHQITIRKNECVHRSLNSDFECDVGRQLFVVDGLESLGWIHRRLFLNWSRRQKIGLLVTSHRRIVSLKVVAELNPSIEVFEEIVNQLLRNSGMGGSIPEAEIQAAFRREKGNFREAFMALYDYVQQHLLQNVV